MSDIRENFMEIDEDFVSFTFNDVVEYVGDSYKSISAGSIGTVVDVFPVKLGVAYAVAFVDGILESYVCFSDDLRKACIPYINEVKVIN